LLVCFFNRERHDLEHAVEVMVDMGLSYKQLRTADGTYQYKIEPDIEHLSDFQSNAGNIMINI
jgi:chromosome transmission fidelity protein 18